MPRKKEKPNPWLTYAKEIQNLDTQFPFQWNGGGGNWEALKKWLFDIASDASHTGGARLSDTEKLEAISEAILNYDKFTPNVHLKIRGYLMRGGLRQFLSEQYDFYNNLVNPTHIVTNHLPSGTYTKEIKTVIVNDGIFPSGTIPRMKYQNHYYQIDGSPGQWSYFIYNGSDGLVEQSKESFHGVVPANQAARLRIDELEATPTPEPAPESTPKRRGRPRKQVEEPTYTFDAKEDSELVKVETEGDW